MLPIAAARPGVATTVGGEVIGVRARRTRRGGSLVEAEVADSSGVLAAVWFNQPYLVDLLKPGLRVFLYGEIKRPYRGRARKGGASLQMVAPEFEVDVAEPGETVPLPPESRGGTASVSPGPSPRGGEEEAPLHLGRLVPIYPTTRGLGQRYLRRLIYAALKAPLVARLPDGAYAAASPAALPRAQALWWIHFPPSEEALARARERLQREEYFRFATRLLYRRAVFRTAGGPEFAVTPDLDRKIRSIFPFRFTPDQDRAVAEISSDLRGPAPMYRLLQGDVGTGKTAVALYALLVAVRNRHQGALMAPTEVLAEQHYHTLGRYLARHPAVRIALLTGALTSSGKREVKEGIAAGRYHLVVGTHALIQESVRFRRLGLAVIDEQHRFGVRERASLRQKGSNPHLLVMTATPIPRSLCLTAYGDLDLSLLTRRPPGRRPVRTILVTARGRARAMEFLRRELRRGRQAYFVYPLIDESEALAVPAAMAQHKRLSREVFPEFPVGLLHGRMPAEEKEERLRRFREGLDRVLVATVLVEVGIDVPNATVLFLEDASRFGLAQLHQLRGRVGRGAYPGYCLVGADTGGPEARARLRAFAATEDGFQIAEDDLRLRGPGDFLGVRQAGWPEFPLGNPLKDLDRFLEVRALAERFFENTANRERFPEWGDHPSRSGLAGEEGPRGTSPGLD